MTCFMCGLDHRSVKLTQVQVSATRETQAGAKDGGSLTVCEDCKKMLLKSNHPLNQNLPNPEPEQQGFVKKGDQEGYPSVRE